jgi:hypothetical protein
VRGTIIDSFGDLFSEPQAMIDALETARDALTKKVQADYNDKISEICAVFGLVRESKLLPNLEKTLRPFIKSNYQ